VVRTARLSFRISRYGVKGALRLPDFPRDYPPPRSYAPHDGEGFPDMSRFALLFTEQEASCYLPDKEFRYLRTVIVTAAVYRGLVSELRRPKTANPST
jgi:hypothetical protein